MFCELRWRELDLDIEQSRPRDGQLVALRIIYNSGHERYEIGCFKVPERRRKLWWYQGGLYPIDPKSLYCKEERLESYRVKEIKWFPLPES